MKLNEVLAPPKTPEFLKTVDQETNKRQYQIFMDDNIAKIANELDRQIKAGNVTVNPSATIQPQQPQPVPQASAQPQTPANVAPSGETPEQKRIRVQKASQQNIDKTATPVVPATSQTPNQIRQQKQSQATQIARAGMTDKPLTKPAVWRSNRTESIKFEELNNLFENIINLDEAVQPMYISDYIVTLFRNTMNNPIFEDDPTISADLQKLANEVEKTYSVDKGRAAISELVKFGFTELSKYHTNKKMSRTSRTPASTTPPVATTTPTSNFGINPDGSITVAGAKGKDAGKILPGDPLYPKFVAYINKQLST